MSRANRDDGERPAQEASRARQTYPMRRSDTDPHDPDLDSGDSAEPTLTQEAPDGSKKGSHRRPRCQEKLEHPACLVPGFDGALFSPAWRDALWAKFFMAAPRRQRQSVEQYSVVKRA